MARVSQTGSAICFGFNTSLQLLGAARAEGMSFRKSTQSQFPENMAAKGKICTTLGRLRERWPELRLERPIHVVSRCATRNCRSPQIAYHYCNAELDRGALLQIDKEVWISSAPLAFTQIAAAMPAVDLLLLGYEMCGTYRRGSAGTPTKHQQPPLMSTSQLRQFLELHPALRGAKKARAALRYLADGAESPREAQCVLLFGLPVAMGGYGLGIPRMGRAVKCNARARAMVGSETMRCDLFWPEARLDVEYQSHAFHEGELNRVHDSRRANALRSMGINVVPVTDNELESLEACDAVANTVRKSLRKRGRTRIVDVHARRLKLRRQLGLPLEPRRTFSLERP